MCDILVKVIKRGVKKSKELAVLKHRCCERKGIADTRVHEYVFFQHSNLAVCSGNTRHRCFSRHVNVLSVTLSPVPHMVTWSQIALPFPKWEVSSPHPPSLPTKHWPVTIIIYFSNHLSSSLWWPLFSLVLKWPYAKYLAESERICCWSSNYVCMYVFIF